MTVSKVNRTGTAVEHSTGDQGHGASTRDNVDAERDRTQRVLDVALGVASSGHDVANGLTLAIGNLDLALAQLSAPPEELQACRVAMQDAASLMRAVMRGETGRAVGTAHVAYAIQNVLRLSRPLWSDRPGICVHTDIHPTPLVSMTTRDVQRVLLNLVLNALGAIGDNGRLTISTWREHDTVIITVRDTGPGLRSTHVGGNFSPFVSQRPGGTGLGLPGSQQLIRRAGGQLTISTGTDGGTIVTITLPVSVAQPTPIV